MGWRIRQEHRLEDRDSRARPLQPDHLGRPNIPDQRRPGIRHDPKLKVGLYGDIAPVKDEGAQKFNVYCVDRKSGKILWERTATSGMPKIMRHPKSTHASPTPATDGKHLIVSFGSEGLFAYDLNGKLLWKKDFGVLDSGFYMVPDASGDSPARP